MSRTGLAAHVPTLDLCREMAKNPALAEAFKESALDWLTYPDGRVEVTPRYRPLPFGFTTIPAPLCGEMLKVLKRIKYRPPKISDPIQNDWVVWLPFCSEPSHFDITKPDALARCCIEAEKAGGGR